MEGSGIAVLRMRVFPKSPVLANGTPGSVRGASGNRRPYRDGVVNEESELLMPRGKGPQFTRFFLPILEVLCLSGGSGTVAEVIDSVIERMKIPESEQAVTLNPGQSRIRNQVQWARLYLVRAAYLDASRREIGR